MVFLVVITCWIPLAVLYLLGTLSTSCCKLAGDMMWNRELIVASLRSRFACWTDTLCRHCSFESGPEILYAAEIRALSWAFRQCHHVLFESNEVFLSV